MDILSYLLEFLQQSKEVGITGLGTFYKKKFPGRYDKEKQSFMPPGYALQFVKEVKAEDAFAAFISSKRNISTDSSKYYIEKFTEEVNKQLELEHEATLENLGRLFYTEHDGLSFEAEKNINYGSEFFGLPSLAEAATEIQKPVEVPLVKSEEEDVFEEIAEAPIAKPVHEKTEQVIPDIENVELDEVHDDLKNTLKHSEQAEENKSAESVEEQPTEEPDQTIYTSEHQEVKAEENETIVVPHAEIEEEQIEETETANEPHIEIPESEEEQVEEAETAGETPIETPKPEEEQVEEIETPDETSIETPESEEEQVEVAETAGETPIETSETEEEQVEEAETAGETLIETPEAEEQHVEEIETPDETPIETPESEEEQVEEIKTADEPHIETPDFIKKQTEENPSRFRLTPEAEVPKTYVNLHEESYKEGVITEAPEFIKEQHAEHPNRFGHDPIDHEHKHQGMSAWLKVTIVILLLLIIAAITYLIKPDLFNINKPVDSKPAVVIDTNKVVIDSAKIKRDSIAKTDSILKASLLSKAKTVKTDTVKKVKPEVTPVAPIPNAGSVTFEVIGTSVKTIKRAEQFVHAMKKYGIEAKIIKAMPGKLIKVSIGSFKTEAEANAQKQILGEKTKIVGLYTQQINNKP